MKEQMLVLLRVKEYSLKYSVKFDREGEEKENWLDVVGKVRQRLG